MALAAAFCCTMTTTVFNSCDKNDDSPAVVQKDTTPAFVQLDFTFNVTQDMLDYCDIVVKYDDGTGEKTENITATEWNKSMTPALPATITFSRIATLKADKDASTAEKIAYTNGYNLNYSILNANGENLNKSGNTSSNNTASMKGANFVEAVGEGILNKTHSFTFDKNGNIK